MNHPPLRNEHPTRLQRRAEEIVAAEYRKESPDVKIIEIAAICAALAHQLNQKR